MFAQGSFKIAAAIFLLGAIVGCSPNLGDTPTPEEILSAIGRPHVGKQGLANALVDDEELTEHVLSGICSGSSHWLSVAERAFPTNYAHLNEEMSSALAVALVINPNRVLEKFGPDICHEPDHLPTACDTSTWGDRAAAALGAMSEDLGGDRQACLARVRPPNTSLERTRER